MDTMGCRPILSIIHTVIIDTILNNKGLNNAMCKHVWKVQVSCHGISSFQVNIMSYDLMMRKSKELLKKGFKVVIFDESHFLKSYQSKRANAAVPIIKVRKARLNVYL